ncbi:hypothetical protein lerEdw1_003742 [Lerista edwardsae]|nr:hypothetical protein lerEdw1_003742 [Lerista edwardsae]
MAGTARGASISAATSSHQKPEQPHGSVGSGHGRPPEQPRTSVGSGHGRPPEQPRTSVTFGHGKPPEQPRGSHGRLEPPRTSHGRLEPPRPSNASAHSRPEPPRTSIGSTHARQDPPRTSIASSTYSRPDQPRVLFPEEQFWAVLRDRVRPKVTATSSWKLMTETNSVSVYRLYDENTGLYEYKVFGVIQGCPPERCADVYMDVRYRAKWDRYVKEVAEKIIDGRTAIYWEVKFPFPLTNRDVSFSQYVFTRERRDLEVDGRKIYVILSKSVNTSKFPEKPGLIRVNHYKQCVAIESDGTNGSKSLKMANDLLETKKVGQMFPEHKLALCFPFAHHLERDKAVMSSDLTFQKVDG